MTAPWPGTAVMTGASRGIGRALAVCLAQRVERVVLLGRDVEGLRETAAGCACAKVEVLTTDLGDRLARGRAFAEVARLEPSYLVHAAGDGLPARVGEIDLAELGRLFEVNCASFVELVQATVPAMTARGFGRILAVGSLAPLRPQPFSIPYTATKAALRATVQSLAVEVVSAGILVNMVSPGGVATRLGETGRTMYQRLGDRYPQVARAARAGHLPAGGSVDPADVARAAMLLLDPDNRVVSGQDLVVAGTQVMR